jgi:membrane fusion protein, multidrug efflux system
MMPPTSPAGSGGAISTREQRSTLRRAGRIFFERLQGRPTLVIVLMVALLVAGAVAGIRGGVSLGSITGSESTDDAYVRADLVIISSHVAGYVQSVSVRDNETVKQGQLVATIRDDDYRAKVTIAEAALEAARSAVDVLERARQRERVDDGSRSRGVLESAETDVKAKEAALELAQIDLGYTRIQSPSDGQLAERASLPGEYVIPGTKIGLVVPLPNVWIVANFRESQMAHMYPGQSAMITVDSAPGVTFHGTVDSFGPTSGALQALLPPDNATGNFTKVAQRFAVKVILAPGQANIDRLRPGMSAIVHVAVGRVRPERSAQGA